MLRGSRWLTTAVLGGLGAIGAGPAWAAVGTVTIDDHAYGPLTEPVHVGDAVTWTNADDVYHDVSGADGPADFVSPLIGQGESWSYTFASAGTFTYLCTLHEGMAASITVEEQEHAEAPAVPGAVDPATLAPAEAPADPVAADPVAASETDVAAADVITAPAAATVVPVAAPQPRLVVDLRLLGAALLTFAVVAMALLSTNARPEEADAGT